MYTGIFNDEGAEVALSTSVGYTNLFYCSRTLDEAALPGSDGQCGPDGGPQCESCKRFQATPLSPRTAEIAELRGRNTWYQDSLMQAASNASADLEAQRRQSQNTEARLRAEILELQKELGLSKRKIRELNAAAEVGDEWTRECDKVWPRLYPALARAFHPDKTGGNEEAADFFKKANAKNELLRGKGRQSATDFAREEKEAVAREAAERESKRRRESEREFAPPEDALSPELRSLLAEWGLESEERWLLKVRVLTLDDFEFLQQDDMKDLDVRLCNFVEAMKARKRT